jgi:ATPase subunit of ABC transporter with duplicated ATPase domains
MDLATKEMLMGALANFEGTMLLVSHDRQFLRALTTRVLELLPDGPHVYPGGYAEYVQQVGREAPGIG